MLTKEQAQKIIAKALSFSTFPECDISLNSSERAFIRFALNDVTTSGFTVEQSMSISSVRDGQSGSTRVDEFDDDALREAVKRTEQLAMIAPPIRSACRRSKSRNIRTSKTMRLPPPARATRP